MVMKNPPGWKRFERKISKWFDRRSVLVVLTVASLIAIFLIYESRYVWFYGDDWAFIIGRRELWKTGSFFEFFFMPHNEHLSTVPVILYSSLVSIFGVDSSIHFMVLLVALHISAASAIYALLHRLGVSWGWSLLGFAWFALLGSGAENLLWAFQIGFVGSVSFGLWHHVLLNSRQSNLVVTIFGTLFSMASLASSGIGICMLVSVGCLLFFAEKMETSSDERIISRRPFCYLVLVVWP
jgi:hypothetical protein